MITMIACTLRYSSVVLLFALCCDLSSSTCPPANPNDVTMSTYAPINESLYDRTYARIDSGRHPLGFYAATWYFNQPNLANPCIKISAPGAKDSMLEIKAETIPPARLCVKTQSNSGTCFQGEQPELHAEKSAGRYSNCIESPGDSTYVEFYCDSGCGEADVNFWYRLVLSPPNTVDWCSQFRNDNRFPTDLAVQPSDATLPSYTTPAPRDGTGTAAQGPSPSSSFTPLLTALLAVFLAASL